MDSLQIRRSDEPEFSCDANGQWWWQSARSTERCRAHVLTCEHCGGKFLTAAIKKRWPKYCGGSCSTIACKKFKVLQKDQQGEKNPNWKGGRAIGPNGYVSLIVPGHHSVTKTKPRVLEHRLVMEKILGRPLYPYENVHHKNGIKTDNRPENLELWATHQPKGQRAIEQKHCPTCTCHMH